VAEIYERNIMYYGMGHCFFSLALSSAASRVMLWGSGMCSCVLNLRTSRLISLKRPRVS